MILAYKVIRHEDESGVSGTGHVADAVIFSDGTTVLHWRGELSSVAIYASLDAAIAIHGHEGKTAFVFDGHGRESCPLESYIIT